MRRPLFSMHWLVMSTKLNPGHSIASLIALRRWSWWYTVVFAYSACGELRTRPWRLIGVLGLPPGELSVFVPVGVVGPVCPPVSLLLHSTVTGALRRMLWMRWLPPMLAVSPSPATTITFISGFTALIASATGSVRPCSVYTASCLR